MGLYRSKYPFNPAKPDAPIVVCWSRWGVDAFGSVAAWTDVAALDAEWANDKADYYITPGGSGGVTYGRYEGFGRWLRQGVPVEMSKIGFTPSMKFCGFVNGRHRFAWMRDHGATALPMLVHKEILRDFKKRFGTTERATVLHGAFQKSLSLERVL